MKILIRSRWMVVIVLVLLIPLVGMAAEKQKESPGNQGTRQRQSSSATSNAHKNHGKKSSDKKILPSKNVSKPQKMPIYRPPLRGAPAGRVAGGTRGVGEKSPCLCTLVPEHVGLTVSNQPCLYYFLSTGTNLPLEFTILEQRAVYPLVETRIQSPTTAGIYAIRLADYGKRLKQGIQYKWFVALVPDEEHRSKDILAAGAIELVDMPPEFKGKLQRASGVEAAAIYAETGIWYDALASLSTVIDQKPGDSGLAKQRASLLEQVGLPEVARYESQRDTNN